jgi:hypothetical protein
VPSVRTDEICDFLESSIAFGLHGATLAIR